MPPVEIHVNIARLPGKGTWYFEIYREGKHVFHSGTMNPEGFIFREAVTFASQMILRTDYDDDPRDQPPAGGEEGH